MSGGDKTRHERDYPAAIAAVNRVEPAPRRVRAMLDGETVFDTTRALYVWEWPNYPQYYIPVADVRPELLVPSGTTQHSPRGTVELYGLRVGDTYRPLAAKVLAQSTVNGLDGTARFEWGALDAWFEEDERVFVHPRNPYVRVDALRSTRTVRLEVDGTVVGASSSPVLVFETGLPTRYYLDRTGLDFHHLVPTETVTECPYKGTTSGYWSAVVGDTVLPDVAWTYDFPTRALSPIAGLIAFYNEKVDIFLDDTLLERPVTHVSPSAQRERRQDGGVSSSRRDLPDATATSTH
jgi:uncharacterized protein (DUF427 family)